jgi:carboxypeptidase D
MNRYLAREDVRKAIHADGFTGKFQGFSSQVYHDLQAYHYTSTRPLLAELRQELPVLLYVGQCDLVCNHLGLKAVVAALGWSGGRSIAAAPRYVWLVDGKPAGYARTQGKLTFLLVLGGSHMVPYSVPGPAQDMIERFIAGRSFDDFLPKEPVATGAAAGRARPATTRESSTR